MAGFLKVWISLEESLSIQIRLQENWEANTNAKMKLVGVCENTMSILRWKDWVQGYTVQIIV